MIIKNKAYINNFSLSSCAGNNGEELFDAILNKKDTIYIDSNYIEDKEVAIGKIDKSYDFFDLMLLKVEEVLSLSNLDSFENTLLVIGSSVGGMALTEKIFFEENSYKNINPNLHPIDAISYILKKHYKFYDDISFSTACTSSANALGYAKEVIEKGIYENVLVIGIDSLSYTTVCGFSALSVLSSKPCTPFDKNREGMNVSEAIAVLLIQNFKTENSVELCGAGYSSDAYHMTHPHPEGKGAIKAMENALKNANLSVIDISYINAHGTGTLANDTAELNAIYTLFSDLAFVSSTKSITGHTLGAAGALEAIISCIAIQKQVLPINNRLIEPENSNIKYAIEPHNVEINYVLSNSFAFGGNNTSLILGKVK